LKEIRTEIDIKASPEKVWKTLTDFNNFSNWNPFIRKIIGEPSEGSKLKINLFTSRGKNRTYKPIVTKVEPFRELRWFGKSFIPGMFNGERIFILEPIGSDMIHFIHIEIFTGFLISLIGNRLDKDMFQSFVQMNDALKKKVEQDPI
jgi:hypothetical protein